MRTKSKMTRLMSMLLVLLMVLGLVPLNTVARADNTSVTAGYTIDIVSQVVDGEGNALPNEELVLLNSAGDKVNSATSNGYGSAIFFNVAVDDSYTIKSEKYNVSYSVSINADDLSYVIKNSKGDKVTSIVLLAQKATDTEATVDDGKGESNETPTPNAPENAGSKDSKVESGVTADSVYDDPNFEFVESVDTVNADDANNGIAAIAEPGIMPLAGDYGVGSAAMIIKWNGTQYEIRRNSNYSTGTGISWTLDNDGNLTMEFTVSGTLQLVKVKPVSIKADILGGGAGGQSAYVLSKAQYGASQNKFYYAHGRGGAGGGGGTLRTNVDVLSQFQQGQTITVTVGEGGDGGAGNGTSVGYWNSEGSYRSPNDGVGGGKSAFGSEEAAGGEVKKGGAGGAIDAQEIDGYSYYTYAGNGNGGQGGVRSGGGGGGIGIMLEASDWVDPQNWADRAQYGKKFWTACYICGYTNATGTWNRYLPQGPIDGNGGLGRDGGGNGGKAASTHCRADILAAGGHNGSDATANSGAGGGGGAFGARPFSVGSGSGFVDTGSAMYGGWLGSGGKGGSGYVKINGQIKVSDYVRVKKVSATPAWTDGNPLYSYVGVKFGVYQSKDDAQNNRNKIDELTIGADGIGQSANEYEADTVLWVRELTRGKGYVLNTNVYSITIAEDDNVQVPNVPQADPDIGEIVKVREFTEYPITEDFAVFKVQWWPSTNHSGANSRTWYFRTIDGEVNFNRKNYLATGYTQSTLFETSDGFITWPLGSVEITEVKAPGRYLLNDTAVRGVIEDKIDDPDIGRVKFRWTSTSTPRKFTYSDPYGDMTFVDRPKWSTINVKKNGNIPEGDANFAGIQVTIYNKSGKSIELPDKRVIADGAAVITITLDADGNASTGAIFPEGTFYAKETRGNDWYNINTSWTSKDVVIDFNDLTYNPDEPIEIPFDDPIKRAGIRVYKFDERNEYYQPEGDSTYVGTVFEIINRSLHKVTVNGKEYQVGQRVMTITVAKHDDKYYAETAIDSLPLGTYGIHEITAPEGNLLNNTEYTIVLRKDVENKQKVFRIDGKDVDGIPEFPVMGGLSVQKVDAETTHLKPQGDASLYKAKYDIYNASDAYVTVNGKDYQVGDYIMSIETNNDGLATTANNVLPYGTYTVKESVAPEGYLVNEPWSETREVHGNNTVFGPITAPDYVQRGDVKIYKEDVESDTRTQGEATLEGTEITIKNISKSEVVVDGVTYQPGQDVKTITVYKVEEGGATRWVAETTGRTLPYGTYELRETKAPEGYNPNTEWVQTFEIREDQELVVFGDEFTGNFPMLEDQVIRGDLHIVKKDGFEGTTLQHAVYELYNKWDDPNTLWMRGETDENGYLAFEGLPYGHYWYKEIQAPLGYELDENIYELNITTEGQVIEHERLNYRRPGTIEIVKHDTNGLVLEDALFMLEYSTDGGNTWKPVEKREKGNPDNITIGGCTSPDLVDGTLRTGKDGIARFEGLRATTEKDRTEGTVVEYRITELESPNGKSLLKEKVYVGSLPLNVINSQIDDTQEIYKWKWNEFVGDVRWGHMPYEDDNFDPTYYCFTLNVDVSDVAVFGLPETGASIGNLWWLMGMALMMSVPVVLYFGSKKRKANGMDA